MQQSNGDLVRVPQGFEGIVKRLQDLVLTPGPIAVNGLLVDSSGSMSGDVEQVLGLMKTTVADMKSEKDMARRTIAFIQEFADTARFIAPPTPVNSLVAPTDYGPGGNTALYGSVADVINFFFDLREAVREACAALHRPMPEMRFALVVITDGGESGITRHRHRELLELSPRAIAEGMTLTAIAIRVDGEGLRKQLGFAPGGVVEVERSVAGYGHATGAVSRTFITSMTGQIPPRQAPAPVSPTGTVQGDVVNLDELPTEPRDPRRPRR